GTEKERVGSSQRLQFTVKTTARYWGHDLACQGGAWAEMHPGCGSNQANLQAWAKESKVGMASTRRGNLRGARHRPGSQMRWRIPPSRASETEMRTSEEMPVLSIWGTPFRSMITLRPASLRMDCSAVVS